MCVCMCVKCLVEIIWYISISQWINTRGSLCHQESPR